MSFPNTAPTYQYLDGTNADGTILGAATTSKVAFWGGTPTTQGTAITTVVNTAPVASSSASAWCYSSSAQALAIITAVNSVITRLQTIGINA